MSTRGEFRIRKDGQEKAMYIARDAYPDYSGDRIVKLLRDIREKGIEKLFDLMISPENANVDGQDFSSKACKLAVMMQRPIECYGYGSCFINNSLFCEHAYVFNLDDHVLEYYKGGQKEPQKDNRYGEKPAMGEYYPCRLCAVFSFDYIYRHTTSELVSLMQEDSLGSVIYYTSEQEQESSDDFTGNNTDADYITRPWGKYRVLFEEDDYRVNQMIVYPGCRISLQSHQRREEHWTIVRGSGLIQTEAARIPVGKGNSAFIPVNNVYRITNSGTDLLVLIEVQIGSYLGDDDVVRYADDYGRA